MVRRAATRSDRMKLARELPFPLTSKVKTTDLVWQVRFPGVEAPVTTGVTPTPPTANPAFPRRCGLDVVPRTLTFSPSGTG